MAETQFLDRGEPLAASFRDPSGFVYSRDGRLLRQVNPLYRENYDHLMASGLYDTLVKDGGLVPHTEEPLALAMTEEAYKIIAPEKIPFISYPYEWSFTQLKDAALLTLQIQKKAFEFGMTLKDCTAYNIQFRKGRPVFIDTLSFEKYQEGQLWQPYRQFCQHFLAPLALMSHKDVRLNKLMVTHLDGIPLDLASKLLPGKTRWNFSLLSHIHLHSKAQSHCADKAVNLTERKMNRMSFQGLVDSLEGAISKLQWEPKGTEWADYYENTNYSDDAMKHKMELVGSFLDKIQPDKVWDLGANRGNFSRLSAEKGCPTVAFDIDPAAVEKHYRALKKASTLEILPLVLDLTNPSPGIGWNNQERQTVSERGDEVTGLALALIHHLAIGNNLPFSIIAGFFSQTCRHLIIEFVPKEDSQVQKLLASRPDIFPSYNLPDFEKVFERYFVIQEKIPVRQTVRTLYRMERKNA